MISNLKKLNIFVLALSLTALPSCSDFLKGKAEKKETLEIKQEAMSCLKDVSLDVAKFIKSESTNQDIEKTFNCFDQTLSQFESKVEGREKADQFNKEELFQIFDKFINNAQISREAISQLLILKSALLGGSDLYISKSEITQLRELIKALKAEAVRILPYAKVFNIQEKDSQFSKETIENAFSQLNLSLKNLLRLTKLPQSGYSFDNIFSLIKALNIIESEDNPYYRLVQKVNALIVGPNEVSSFADREMYIDSMSLAMKLYIFQKQSFVDFKFDSPKSISDNLSYFNVIINFLESTLQYKKQNVISEDTIDPLITAIHKAGTLPVKLNLDTILNFYKTIMVKVFQAGLHSDIQAFKGLERVHFVNLKKEIAIYKIYSDYLSANFYKTDTSKRYLLRYSDAAFKDNLKQQNFANSVKALSELDVAVKQQTLTALNEFKNEDFKKYNLMYRSNRIVVGWNQNIWDQNWKDLVTSLNLKMMARLMILGWGELNGQKEVAKSYLNEQGAVQWYSEFKPIGIELKSFDPRAENLGVKTLTTANLFTKVGDANKQMNFSETIEQLAILVTAGSVIPDQMLAGFEKAHCQLAEMDVFGNNWNNEACVVVDLQKNFAQYFMNLPYTVHYLKKLKPAEFEAFYNELMDITRTDAANKGVRLETADLKGVVTLIHYIESLFVIYDTNHNMQLSVEEIRKAYSPRFESFATQYAHKTSQAQLDKFTSTIGYGCYTEQDLIKESFVYLVIHQVTPKQSDLNLFPCNPIYKRAIIDQKGTVDRKGLINTFKILKAVLGS